MVTASDCKLCESIQRKFHKEMTSSIRDIIEIDLVEGCCKYKSACFEKKSIKIETQRMDINQKADHIVKIKSI